jgi:small subunit ribosomal protein S4
MGDPKKIRKKYDTPTHPWQKVRIEDEIVLKKEYGLKNKKEIWKFTSMLKGFKNDVKRLNAMTGSQAIKEQDQLRARLLSLGLLKVDMSLDSVLSLETKDLMERRLQTVIVRKNLVRSVKQARQFIVHRHILVAGKKITVPSYLVKIGEEDQISFALSSSLADPSHPERFEEIIVPIKKKEKKSQKEVEEVVAFDEVPKDEEQIIKEGLEKKGVEKKK